MNYFALIPPNPPTPKFRIRKLIRGKSSSWENLRGKYTEILMGKYNKNTAVQFLCSTCEENGKFVVIYENGKRKKNSADAARMKKRGNGKSGITSTRLRYRSSEMSTSFLNCWRKGSKSWRMTQPWHQRRNRGNRKLLWRNYYFRNYISCYYFIGYY